MDLIWGVLTFDSPRNGIWRATARGFGKKGMLRNTPATEDCFCCGAWRTCSCSATWPLKLRPSSQTRTAFNTHLTGKNCGHKIVKHTRFKLNKWLSETIRLIPFFTLAIVAFSVPAALGHAIKPIPPDERFKPDILLVVAHPDDETEVTCYLARVIFDEHKRVAVIFGTRGDGSGNAAGQEQAAALGAEREIEARQALNVLGTIAAARQSARAKISQWDGTMYLRWRVGRASLRPLART